MKGRGCVLSRTRSGVRGPRGLVTTRATWLTSRLAPAFLDAFLLALFQERLRYHGSSFCRAVGQGAGKHYESLHLGTMCRMSRNAPDGNLSAANRTTASEPASSTKNKVRPTASFDGSRIYVNIARRTGFVNTDAEGEPVSDYLAPPTPLFPLPAPHTSTGQGSREGEICSFLRHSVRLLAEGVAGPARICNAGAGCRDTKVAPRGRGGQGDGAGSLSRVLPQGAHTATGRPQGTPLRMAWSRNPAWG